MEPLADIHFDGWILRRSSGELVKDGVSVRLQSQPLAILEELLARPGEVVTREALIAKLWPRGVVEFDTALNSAMRRLRTALGEHAGSSRYIETIPKRGYRFIGQLESPPAQGAPGSVQPRDAALARPRWRWTWQVAATAVLGFATSLLVVAERGPVVRGDGTTSGVPAAAAQPASIAPEAYERFARARYLLQRRADGDVTRSLSYFEQVVGLEPDFPQAWAGLASACWIETVEGRLPLRQGLSKVRVAAERALAIDPRNAEAHLRLANYWRWNGQRDIGERHFQQAIALEPDHPLVLGFRALLAFDAGRLDDAISLQRRALATDPLSVPARHNLAVWLYLAGRTNEARDVLLGVRDVDPTAVNPGGMMSLLLVLGRQFEAALALAPHAPDDEVVLQSQAMAYHGLGRNVEAEAALRKMLDSNRPPDAVRVAEVYAFLGQSDLAFHWLRVATEVDPARNCPGRWCWPLEMAEQSPFLKSLRTDPRWVSWTDAVKSRGAKHGASRRG
jgi:DNA-binding winged helix-turn-helix (wHTH) protein/tetratricopeptide (TPR) repeat protein